MDKKYKIFISSTLEDLREERSKVMQTILEMGHIPICMEVFSAGGTSQWKRIQKEILSSDSIFFMNVMESKSDPFYDVNSHFPTRESADSYKVELFSVNDEDRTNQVRRPQIETLTHADGETFYATVDLPLHSEEKSAHIVCETSYTIPIDRFFQAKELKFPCQNYNVIITLLNTDAGEYFVRSCTFAAFNKETDVHAAKAFSAGPTATISIPDWTLPGSGYATTIQRNAAYKPIAPEEPEEDGADSATLTESNSNGETITATEEEEEAKWQN